MFKKTVTIGIPAYNEEQTIAKLLDSILMQKASNFNPERIIVMCDGATDKTAQIVKGYCKISNRIKLSNDHKRIGKAGRLNLMIKQNNSDILIFLDADTVLVNNIVLQEFVKKFKNPKVGLVGGHDSPVLPTKFWEKIFVTFSDLWYETRHDLNNGDSIHNIHGCCMALSRAFCQRINVPSDIIADDDYLYLSAKSLGFKFSFAKKAFVNYKAASTIRDYIEQSGRFLKLKHQIAEVFGEDAYKYYLIPPQKKFKAFLKVFAKNPLSLTLAVVLQIYLRVAAGKQKVDRGGLWIRVASSKSANI